MNVKGLEDASQASKDLADAEKELTNAQRDSRKVQLEFQRDAEKLRQIRDDETKSFQERIKANDRLALKLKEQQKLEEQTALIALEAAKRKIAANSPVGGIPIVTIGKTLYKGFLFKT